MTARDPDDLLRDGGGEIGDLYRRLPRYEPPRRLEVTHFSPMTGAEDVPENYHRISYTLTHVGHGTLVALSQDNNPDEEAAGHSARNWQAMLEDLKRHVENSAPAS